MKGQLRISRPAQRRPNTRRMTERQRVLIDWLRLYAGPIHVDSLGHIFGYAHPRRACERLVARGLVRKVRRGVYVAVVLSERSAYDARDGRSAD